MLNKFFQISKPKKDEDEDDSALFLRNDFVVGAADVADDDRSLWRRNELDLLGQILKKILKQMFFNFQNRSSILCCTEFFSRDKTTHLIKYECRYIFNDENTVLR